MKVRIDPELCTGHGRCYSLAPSVFADDEAGFGYVTATGDLTDDELGAAKLAVRNCPERAIELFD